MTTNTLTYHLTEPELLDFADDFAKTLPKTGLIALWGDLGAGKTTFVRRVIQAVARDPELIVSSPTFNLIQIYELQSGELWHCDLYRMTCPDECLELGILEAMQDALCFVEWPDRMGTYLPNNRIDIQINLVDDQSREFIIVKR